jgi:hypothetical protein
VKDSLNRAVEGAFQYHELQEVYLEQDQLYFIEKILKKRKRGGIQEYFVKWVRMFQVFGI